MRAYVFNPFSPVPVNPKSHVRGWAIHWAEMMNAEIASKDTDIINADVLYLDHGVNFSGGLNLFGGVTGEVMDRLEDLLFSKATLWSLDIPMPDYVSQLEKRVGQATCSKRLTPTCLRALRKRFDIGTWLNQADLGTPHVTIGDSHSTAFAPAGSAVLRTNGQTLHGALNKGLIRQQLDSLSVAPERVTLVYGSIDIRHHIGRQDDPVIAVLNLANRYAAEVRFIKGEYCCEVEVAAPVPVEYEGRKIPQTGFYEGTPFKGSQAERREWTERFIDCLKTYHGIQVVQPPARWYEMDGKEYAKTCMELGSSVHIAPTHYRRYGWEKK